MTPALDLLTDALAAYRGTRLVTTDTIVDPLRDRVVRAAYEGAGRAESVRRAIGVEPGEWSEFARRDSNPPKLAELITCPYCSGMWVGFAVVLASRLAPRAWRPVSRALALAAAAALVLGLER